MNSSFFLTCFISMFVVDPKGIELIHFQDGLQFSDEKFVFDLLYSEIGDAKLLIKEGSKIIYMTSLCRSVTDIYTYSVFKRDLDGNGYEDIVLEGFIYGTVGHLNSCKVLDVVLFFPGNTFELHQFSTFSEGKEAFIDLDGDGSLEFVCTVLHVGLEEEYYYKNVFAWQHHRMVNVTDSFMEFIGKFMYVNEKMVKVSNKKEFWQKEDKPLAFEIGCNSMNR